MRSLSADVQYQARCTLSTRAIQGAAGYSLLELSLSLLLIGCIFLWIGQLWLLIVRDIISLDQSIHQIQECETLSLRLHYLAKYANKISLHENNLLFYQDVPIKIYLLHHRLYQKISDSPGQLLMKNIKSWSLESDAVGIHINIEFSTYYWPIYFKL